MNKRIALLAGFGVVVAITTVTWYFAKPAFTPSSPTPPVQIGAVTIEGEVVCLPHKNSDGPQTLECALGIKDDAGRYYGLRDTSEFPPTHIRFRVRGNLQPPASDDRYNVAGNITVTELTKL